MELLSEKITYLNQVTLESLNEPSEEKIIEKFTEAGVKILGADFGFVWANNPGSTDLELVYKSPFIPFTPLQPREDGSIHAVMQTKSPLLIDDYPKSEFIRDDAKSYLKSVAVIPLFFQNHAYGSIIVCFKDFYSFKSEDFGLCTFIGNAVAQAVTINRLMKSEHEARVEAESQKFRFQALIENSYDIIALISRQGEIGYISPSVARISGHEPETLIGRSISSFIYEKDFPAVNAYLSEILNDPDSAKTVEFRSSSRDGSLRWLEATAVNMLDNPGVASIVVNLRDITERKHAQETILHQALHDPLTHLPNRKELKIRLNQALETAKRHKRILALLFLDLDRFKNINDSLGHAVGDTLLKVMATRFTACVRKEDTVARLGGDEFLILINEINSSQEAVAVAKKILKAVAVPVQIGEHTFHSSVSIGIATYPEDGEDRETLKKHADIALYRAKENGRNTYSLFDPSTDTYASEKFALENELRQAIALGGIALYYQPIISIKTGRILAMEALARWHHPHKGLVMPQDFIPLAEESGLIIPLSEYILKAACRQYKQWEVEGFPKFRIAVNMSARSFADNEFVPNMARVLEEFEVEPSSLEIEITESVAMGNLELTSENLKQLKKMGVHITIDDFGTGYSSLSYLKRFPIHNLKIDRSFVRHCITSEQDAGITRTVVNMAHSLNLKVIAEGVETDQQLSFLESLGCNAAQGFYIAQPLPAEKVGEWLEEKNLKKKIPVAA